MDNQTKKELEIFATQIRMGIIEGTYNAKAGHPGGSLSSADLFAYLYGKEMRYNAKDRNGTTETDLCFQRVTVHRVFTAHLHTRDFSLLRI